MRVTVSIAMALLCPFLYFKAQAQFATPATYQPVPDVAASLSAFTPEQMLIQNYLTNKQFLKVGSKIWETADLKKVYELRGFAPIWVEHAQPNSYVIALKTMLRSADRHGLLPQDYWGLEQEQYLQGINEQNWVGLEIAATQAYITYAQHLSDGRFDPSLIDNDIKYAKKVFVDYPALADALMENPESLAASLDKLAPQNKFYWDLYESLAELKELKRQGGYKMIPLPSTDLKPGMKSATISALKARLVQMGFIINNMDQVYDSELSQIVTQFQRESNISVISLLRARSSAEIWTFLNVKIENRIAQLEANLEKLRWLPRTLESRYAWVNINATELKLFDSNEVVMQFKTINGQKLRKTPMMRDMLTSVIVNPTWTATDSIVIQDKLPQIQKDLGYLAKAHMTILRREGNVPVDPATLDWKRRGREIVKSHWFVMDPGPTNALGIVKFNLNINNEAIYMHDTNDRHLFREGERHLSSGCIRLEKPVEFAVWLLKNVPGYDMNSFSMLTAKGVEGEVFETNKLIRLPKEDHLPVYIAPMTVERTADGRIRFMNDYYGQDRRIALALFSPAARDTNF